MPSETILSLPFAYEARYVRPRHRNESSTTVRDTLPVRVPVAGIEEAPVAFVLDWSEKRGEAVEPLVTRHFEGRLFRAVTDGGGGGVGLATFEADVNRPGGDWRATWIRDRPGRPTWSGDQYPTLPILKRSVYGRRAPMRLMDLQELALDVADHPAKFRLKGTDREERASEAQAFLSANLVCIDGMMWSTSHASEPYWCVHGGKVTFSANGSPLWYVTPFRLDRFDQAVAYAEMQSGTYPDLSGLPAVDIPDATLLRRDDGIMLAHRLRSAIPGRLGSVSKAEGWPQEAETLRESLDFWCKGELGLREASSLLEGFGKLREALAGLPRDGYPGAAELVERSGPALERWALERLVRPDMTASALSVEDDEMAFASLSP